MRRWWSVMLWLPLLTACLGATPERARIQRVVVLSNGAGLEVDQQLRLSTTMLRALSQGIPLRLVYRARGCRGARSWQQEADAQLAYAPVRRVYELRLPGGELRRFARRSAMLAALDRIRLPLGPVEPGCEGSLAVRLDLAALPTPLRFPALFRPADWRLISPEFAWTAAAR